MDATAGEAYLDFTAMEPGSKSRLRRVLSHLGIALLILFGHWCCSSYRLPPLSPRVAVLPERLSQTGLYADAAQQQPAADLRAFAPAYELWKIGRAHV